MTFYVQGYRHRIYVMNADGTNKRLLTRPTGPSYLAFENYTNPVWSPDGTRIAFTSNLGGQNRLYVMNANGTNMTRLSNGSSAERPSWSPDGTKLVFADQSNGQRSIMRIDADGTGETALSSSGDFDPAWSPDGAHIVFVSYRDDFDVEIYMMDPDGANQTRLTNSPGDDLNPLWSPDGTRIAFVRNLNFTDREILVMNADGGNQVNITNSSLDDYDPAWSPDGAMIAFTSERSGQGIYVMAPDGSNPTNLSTFGVKPVWQPLGTGLPPPPQTYSITAHDGWRW